MIVLSMKDLADFHEGASHLHRSPVTLPIPGTTTPAHLDQNLAAAQIELSAEDVTAITALAQET